METQMVRFLIWLNQPTRVQVLDPACTTDVRHDVITFAIFMVFQFFS